MSFIAELKRRNVLRVGIAYIALSWLLIQVVETLFPVYGLTDAAIRLVVAVLGVGFVPALVVSWVFELTPQGLKRDSELDRSDVRSTGSDKALDRIIMVALALALGYFAFDKFVLDPARDLKIAEAAEQQGRSSALAESYGDKSIAVLPFLNMSSDPEQDYFSDGIAEELLNLLARIPELRVISRSSAFSFRGENINIPDVAEILNVAHILEGSVRKVGNQVRITVQLIEARSDTHLWADTYDRSLDDIFAIQDEVAAQVVQQLRLTLLGDKPRAQPANVAAYVLVLEARQIVGLQRWDELGRAEDLLHRALEIEPGYVDALVELAGVCWAQRGQASPERQDELTEKLESMRQRVLQLDPNNARVKAKIAWDKLELDNDIVGSARLNEEALQAEPSNLAALHVAAWIAKVIGRTELAIRIFEYVVERDPIWIYNHYNLGRTYSDAGRYEDALRSFAMARSLKHSAPAISKIGRVKLLMGDPAAALQDFQSIIAHDEYRLHGSAMALHDLGREQESVAALRALQKILDGYWPAGIADINAWIGEPDEAFRQLRIAAEQFPSSLLSASFNPFLNNLHDDPRWLPFLEEIGRTPAQLAAIEFNPRLPRDMP